MAETKKKKSTIKYFEGDRVVTRDKRGVYQVLEYRNGEFRRTPWLDSDNYAIKGGFFFQGAGKRILSMGRHGEFGTTVQIDSQGNLTTLDNYNRRVNYNPTAQRKGPRYFVDRSAGSLETYEKRVAKIPEVEKKERKLKNLKQLKIDEQQADINFGYMSNNELVAEYKKLIKQDSYRLGRPKFIQTVQGLEAYMKNTRGIGIDGSPITANKTSLKVNKGDEEIPLVYNQQDTENALGINKKPVKPVVGFGEGQTLPKGVTPVKDEPGETSTSVVTPDEVKVVKDNNIPLKEEKKRPVGLEEQLAWVLKEVPGSTLTRTGSVGGKNSIANNKARLLLRQKYG